MSRTLFWYLLKDLLKVFLLTSMALAGIMSFGGLMRPLMEYGLSGTQIARMLAYFMPATQTYSLPIAALFATTVVYGRISADNELTACRAAGISHLALIAPAFVLGLALALLSLLSLSLFVPHFTLKAERVAFASLAEVVQKSIARSHQIKLPGYTIHAESAAIVPAPSGRSDEEIVVLERPMFCAYEPDELTRITVPSEFYLARRATAIIRQGEDVVEFTALLEDGTTFPRELGGEMGGVETAQFGPVPMPSPIRENTRFMDIQQLRAVLEDPRKSREVRLIHAAITRQDQEQAFLADLLRELRAGRPIQLASGPEVFSVRVLRNARLPRAPIRSRLDILSPADAATRAITVERIRGGRVQTRDEARAIAIRAQSDPEASRIRVELVLEDVLVGTEDGRPGRQSVRRVASVPMNDQLREIGRRTPEFYVIQKAPRGDELRSRLAKKLYSVRNAVTGEMHGRASFAVSCLILVLVGSALGMMFRTGNYLSAFALSVVPALLSLTLIVTGQHVAENMHADNPGFGIALIWSGNFIVLALALSLLMHLRRQ